MKKYLILFLVWGIVSCEDQPTNPEFKGKGTLSFSFNDSTKSSARIANNANPDALILSIKDEGGEFIFNMEEFNLIKIGDDYVTKSIELDAGEYTVEDFIVVNENDSALFLAPKRGSDFAKLVNHPLPYQFTVNPSDTSLLILEVIDADLGEAVNFGYTIFSFRIVNTLEKGLVAFYPFNGTANDESKNNNNGMVQGAVLSYDRFDSLNSAYFFDGVNDYIEVPDDSTLHFSKEFSLSVWINLYSPNYWGSRIIDKSIGSTIEGYLLDTYDMDKSGKKIRFHTANPWVYLSETELNLGQWYHIVTTFKDGVGKIYINGKLNAEHIGENETITNAPVPLRFGFDTGVRAGQDFADGFHGLLDDIMIYNRALTSKEVSQIFNQQPAINLVESN